MSYPKGEIFIGDLVRAYDEIGVSDKRVAEIVARLLGFEIELVPLETKSKVTATSLPQPEAPAGETKELSRIEPQADTPAQEKPSRPKSDSASVTNITSEIDLSLMLASVTRFDIERFPKTKMTGKRETSNWHGWEQPSGAKFPHQPLLRPEWTRGILSEISATEREAGGPDLQRVVEALARGKDLNSLPASSVLTLARGCQVLTDISAGMAPFAKDCWELLRALEAIVGRERVELMYFEDCPVHGVEAELDLELKPYKPPNRGTPVLLISDLGISNPPFSMRRATLRDWLKLILILEEAGCPVIALVPYPDSRWPKSLARVLPIIQWDRYTTATSARRIRHRS